MYFLRESVSHERWANAAFALSVYLGVGMFSSGVFAAENAASPVTGKPFATVWRIRGDVAAEPADGVAGKAHKLRVGDIVYVGENVRATSVGEAVLKTEDAGIVAVRPRAEFIAERFSAEDKPTDGLTIRLITGSLRIISGWIAKTNRAGNSVVTSTATIGIRGTDHEPYVLSAEMAQATSSKEGTYDKVNRGGTTIEVDDNKLDVDAGRVGFVRAAKKGVKERGLLTLLLPVLLDKVPSFYVPGEFDAEMDRISQTAEQDSLRQLEQRRKGVPAAAISKPSPECNANAIAKTWISQLDAATARRDAAAIMALFGSEAHIRANVRATDGSTSTLDLDREDLAQSSVAALKSLKAYKQRRVTIEGKVSGDGSDAGCDRIAVSSTSIEQGIQGGKPYRFEAQEEYTLQSINGKWLAIKAETTQK